MLFKKQAACESRNAAKLPYLMLLLYANTACAHNSRRAFAVKKQNLPSCL